MMGRDDAYGCYVAELVPSDGKELERVDDDACAGDVPQGEDDDGVDDDLGTGGIRKTRSRTR